jgi:hypothetical protein
MSFTNKIKALLMVSTISSVISAHATDNETNTREDAEIAYRTAFAALDLLNKGNSSWTQGRHSLQITDQLKDFTKEQLIATAQEQLESALKLGHPFALDFGNKP